MTFRISEEEILIATLKLLISNDGPLTTSELIELLTEQFNPKGKDADIIDGRSDTYFSQKVRNIVSHRNEESGIVARGLAIYDNTKRPGSLMITESGIKFASKH